MTASKIAFVALALVVSASCGRATTPVATSSPEQSAVSVSASPACTVQAGADESAKQTESQREKALLTDVRVGEPSGCAPRVVFEFRSGTPGYRVSYKEDAFMDTSGKTVSVEGKAFLQVRFEPASGVDLAGETATETYRGPKVITPDGRVVKQVRRVDDFEAVLVWAVGLDARRPFKVSVLSAPPRVVIDVSGP